MKIINQILLPFKIIKRIYKINKEAIISKNLSRYGYAHQSAIIEEPSKIKQPHLLFADKLVKIRNGFNFISKTGELHIGKYTTIAQNVTIVTGNHRSTVGVPQSVLGASHINDVEQNMYIGEDVWVGTNVTLLYGTHISRGAIIGACSLVNKFIPPYAIVAGIPAKIIGCKFTKEQIMTHEKELYLEKDRLSFDEINKIYEQYYKGIKVYGTDSLSVIDKNKRDLYIQKHIKGPHERIL